ncbi:MAG: cell division protein FtsB [Burkholderiaceae bacterium]
MSLRPSTLLLLALLAVLHAQIWFGRGSVGNVAQMQQKLAAQQNQNVQARQTNERLAAEVRDLQEGLEMVEERARSELGMVKPGEIYVQFTPAPRPEPSAAPAGARASARSAAPP